MLGAVDKLSGFVERRRAPVASVAIALDPTLVRLILVPATMEIVGRWNWWLLRSLARVLPRGVRGANRGLAGQGLAR